MDSSFRTRTMICLVLTATAMLVLLPGCGDSEDSQPTSVLAQVDLSGLEPRLSGPLGSAALTELLVNPPRIPSGLRDILAREIRDRHAAEGTLKQYRLDLVRLGDELRSRGMIGSGQAFAEGVLEAQGSALEVLYPGSKDHSEFYERYVLDGGSLPTFGYRLRELPSVPKGQGGLGRVLRIAGQKLTDLEAEELMLALAISGKESEDSRLDINGLVSAWEVSEGTTPGKMIPWAAILKAAGLEAADVLSEQSLRARLTAADCDLRSVRRLEQLAVASLADNQAELAVVRARVKQLKQQVTSLSTMLSSIVKEGQAEAANACKELAAFAEPTANGLSNQARLKFAQESLYSERPVAERIAELKAEKIKGPYAYVNSDQKRDMIATLEQQERREEKFGNKIDRSKEACQAATDVVDALMAWDLVEEEDAAKIHMGIDIAKTAIDIYASFQTGNVFGLISGVANLATILAGKEPKPSPEEARHEQVMEALGTLADGQQAILERLADLAKQVHALHLSVNRVQEIARSTHQLAVDEGLEGLRDCRNFAETRDFFSVSLPDPQSGKLQPRPDLGPSNYRQLVTHFEKHKRLFTNADRFLNDQVRGETLSILKVAENEKQAARLAAKMNRKPGWIKDQIMKDRERIAEILQYVQRNVKPEFQAMLLGSLVHPTDNAFELNEKLWAIADKTAAASHWEQAHKDLELSSALREIYNPLLVEEIVESSLFIQPYRLVQIPGKALLPPFEALCTPGFDPSPAFGSSQENRSALVTKPLRDAQRLLQKSIAQNALMMGDVILPLLAFPAHSHKIARHRGRGGRGVRGDALRFLGQHPRLRESAIRYIVIMRSKLSAAEYLALQHKVLSMMNDAEDLCRKFDEKKLDEEDLPHALKLYADAVSKKAPAWKEPMGLVRKERGKPPRVIRKGYPKFAKKWDRFFKGLDLDGSLPRRRTERERYRRDQRVGSDFTIETYYMPRGRSRKTLYVRTVLPRPEEVESGKLITTDLLPILRRQASNIERALLESTMSYPPNPRDTQAATRLHRELLLRALHAQAGTSLP